MRRRAVFLDRDGVINVRLPNGAYVTRWEEFTFCVGAPEGMKLLADAGYLLIVVTNQRGIGRGLMTESDLDDVHRRMREELEGEGVLLEAVYHCPHDLDAACRCRKPEPGMIEDGLRRFDLDAASSWIVGDSASDLAAGRAAGVTGILVGPTEGSSPADALTAPTLLEAARIITAAGGNR